MDMGRRKGEHYKATHCLAELIRNQRLIWKLNWKVVGWGWIAYLALNLDLSSLVQANADHFLKDLHMNTNG